jgi:hypothetical protein
MRGSRSPDLVENPVGETTDQTTSNIAFQYAELGIRRDARYDRLDLAAESLPKPRDCELYHRAASASSSLASE